MSVDRLSKKALQKILSGQVREESTCVIKFYANKEMQLQRWAP